MIFDTSNEQQGQKFKERANFLYEKGAKIEILEKSSKRTYSQNNYLHLIIGWFALEYGETIDYIKQEFFKKIVNENLFKYEFINYKTGEVREGWKSTAKLTKTELTEAIERFRNYSEKNMNLYLPEPKDIAHLDKISNEMEKHTNKIYL